MHWPNEFQCNELCTSRAMLLETIPGHVVVVGVEEITNRNSRLLTRSFTAISLAFRVLTRSMNFIDQYGSSESHLIVRPFLSLGI
jgi:hypothetical protein